MQAHNTQSLNKQPRLFEQNKQENNKINTQKNNIHLSLITATINVKANDIIKKANHVASQINYYSLNCLCFFWLTIRIKKKTSKHKQVDKRQPDKRGKVADSEANKSKSSK